MMHHIACEHQLLASEGRVQYECGMGRRRRGLLGCERGERDFHCRICDSTEADGVEISRPLEKV